MFIPLHDANRLKHIHLQYVTLALILVNVAIWFFFMNPVYANEDAIKAAVYSCGFIPVVASGQEVLPFELQRIPPWASYVTYAFLHGDLLHLGGNMLFIWVFGDNVEDALGHLRYLFFYLCCAVAGAFAHAWCPAGIGSAADRRIRRGGRRRRGLPPAAPAREGLGAGARPHSAAPLGALGHRRMDRLPDRQLHSWRRRTGLLRRTCRWHCSRCRFAAVRQAPGVALFDRKPVPEVAAAAAAGNG